MSSAYLLIFALQCLFPIFDQGLGEYLGLSILNRDGQAREYTVTATSSDGMNVQTRRMTLDPGAQRAAMVNQFLGAAPPASGWIRVDSSASGCPLYLTSGNADLLSGTDADEASATAILLPDISVNTGFTELEHTDTEILIVNPGSSPAAVVAELAGLDGVVKGSLPLAIPANGSRSGRISEIFRDALPNNSLGGKRFEGFLRLAAPVAISAWQRIETPLSRSILRGIKVPTEFSTGVIPHFVFGGDYDAILNVLNPGTSSTTTIELRAFDDLGNRIGETIQMTLGPGEGRRAHVADVFRIVTIQIFPPPVITGYISIRQVPSGPAVPSLPPISASVEIIAKMNGTKSAALMFPLGYISTVRWSIPFAASSQPYFSGYAVVNANELLAVQNQVEVEVFDSAGQLVNRRVHSLSPRARLTALIPPGLSSGYLRFTSDFPVYVTGSIGTTSLNVLDQVPAIPQ